MGGRAFPPWPIYKGCDQSLNKVDPSMNHCRGCTLIYQGHAESLKGVDPSMNHRGGCTLIKKGCTD